MPHDARMTTAAWDLTPWKRAIQFIESLDLSEESKKQLILHLNNVAMAAAASEKK